MNLIVATLVCHSVTNLTFTDICLSVFLGRELLKEGELLKISRKATNARYFVLLSDCLLYCTSSTSSLSGVSLRVSYTIPLDYLKISLPSKETQGEEDSEEALEFNITSNVRSCTLRARYKVKTT